MTKSFSPQAGLSLAETLVALTIASIVFGGAMKLATTMVSQREVVDKRIDLDGTRWYIRDALDCKGTLGVNSKSRLPLNCADFPPGKDLSLRAVPLSGSGAGAEINRVFEKTQWKFRAFCQNNALVVQYQPRKFKSSDAGLNGLQPMPTDLLPLRNPSQSVNGITPTLPASVGFSPVGNQFSSDKPFPCPPTNSLGSLIALVRFAGQTVLNSAHVDDGMDKFKDQLKAQDAAAASGVSSGFSGLAKDIGTGPGTEALQKAVAQANAASAKWMADLATNAIRKGGEAVAAQVASGVMSGKGVNTQGILQTFTAGALDNAAQAIGAPPVGENFVNALNNGKVGIAEIFSGANTIDSGLDVFAKIPLKMMVAATDVQTSIENRMDSVANILTQGIAQNLPKNQLTQLAVNAVNSLEKYLKKDVPVQYAAILNQNIAVPLYASVASEVATVKNNLAKQFADLEYVAKLDPNPQIVQQNLAKIAARKTQVFGQVDAMQQQLNATVTGMVNNYMQDFMNQMAVLYSTGSQGMRAILNNLLNDVQKSKDAVHATFQDALNKVKVQMATLPQAGVQGNPIFPDANWRDLYDGASSFCKDEFTLDPLRDFAPDSNPCPFVENGRYPFLAGKRNGQPDCCREVESTGGNAQCGAQEVAFYGGAECSGYNQPLSGSRVFRSDVMPIFQGQGLGMAAGFLLGWADGGLTGIPPKPPIPHQHVVQGGANVMVLPVGPGALTVNNVFYSSGMWLGGFLRGNGTYVGTSGKPEGQAASCVFANGRRSRFDDWTGANAQHQVRSRILCCPLLGVQ